MAETFKYRVSRAYLNGKKKGAIEIAIDNLPGFLDNLKINDKG